MNAVKLRVKGIVVVVRQEEGVLWLNLEDDEENEPDERPLTQYGHELKEARIERNKAITCAEEHAQAIVRQRETIRRQMQDMTELRERCAELQSILSSHRIEREREASPVTDSGEVE